ncbi:hypothetical protein [Clostridium sp. JNZ J1-5]
MKKSKRIRIIAVIILALLEFTGVIPYIVARTTASIYVARNYPNSDLKFDSAEYAYGFGEYSVRYKSKQGKDLVLSISPADFPVIITYDSIKGQC